MRKLFHQQMLFILLLPLLGFFDFAEFLFEVLLFGLDDYLVGQQEATLIVEEGAHHDPPELVEIRVGEEHVASRELPISPSSADFLNIVLDGPRQIVVNDRLDVALVDAHAESDGAAEDGDLVVDELLLNLRSLLVRLASVIASCLYSILLEKLSQLIGCSSLGSEDEDACEATEGGRPQQLDEGSRLLIVTRDRQLEIQT